MSRDKGDKPTKQEKKLHFGSTYNSTTGARRTIVDGKVVKNVPPKKK